MSPASSLEVLAQRLRESRQRLLIRVGGEASWCREQVAGPLSIWLQGRGLLVGDLPVAGLEPISARRVPDWLGQTLDFAVVDAFAGFNPNAFGQLSGAIDGGGVLLLLTPPLAQWPDFADPEYASLCVEPYRPEQLRGRYLAHLEHVLRQSAEVLEWQQGRPPVFPELPSVERLATASLPCRSTDQAEAVALILQTAHHRARPLVLSADRGRGKSAALGIAAAELMQAGKSVIVTAFSRAAIGSLLERVQALAPERLEQLSFYRPDELLQAGVEADLLLVDEAATIPTPLLLQLLQRFPRAVFATTLHGYEGNGQGFALRFLHQLRARYPKSVEYRLGTPIRWAAPDPLEQISHRMLLLDVDAGEPVRAPKNLGFATISQAELAVNSEQLRNLFGLLVLAHYRTSPGDLRILLDSPNMRIYQARAGEDLLGCVLLAEEGPLPDALAQAVWAGKRRPRGHLLPQTLIAQEGWQEVAPWRAWRVVRIAVHPAAQQSGIGSRLLQHIEQDALAAGVDYLGASFAASEGLLKFWQGNGFVPLRLGEQRDPVAGSHALLVLKPLTAEVKHWLPAARSWYRRSVLRRLPGGLQDLEAEYLPKLLQGTGNEHLGGQSPLSAPVWQRLQGFAQAQRTLESSLLPLIELLEASLHRWEDWAVTAEDQRLLCDRVLRQLPPAAVARPKGKRAQLDRLRQLCALLMAKLAAESPSALQG